jgi:hypothetical protein
MTKIFLKKYWIILISACCISTGTQAFLDYLKLAKRSEAFTLTPIEHWEIDTTKKNKHFNTATLNRQLQEKYLLAKCQRNEWYNGKPRLIDAWPDKKDAQSDFIAWDGFKALKQYSNTKYYSEVLNECGYFNTYIQKAH